MRPWMLSAAMVLTSTFASATPASRPAKGPLALPRELPLRYRIDVTFEPARIQIRIVDSLSGGAGLAGMDETTVFEIDHAVAPGELRGKWREGTRSGTFRMVRARGLKVLK